MTALYANSFENIVAKTAAYQVKIEDHGTIFTTRGASSGTIIFTLPATADLQSGWRVKFYAVGAACMSVASSAADAIVAFNDADADAVTFVTGSEIIGAGVEMVFDGTQFLAFLNTEETQTMTVTT